MRIAFTPLLLIPSIATAQQVPPAVAVADSVFNRGEWATARRLYNTDTSTLSPRPSNG